MKNTIILLIFILSAFTLAAAEDPENQDSENAAADSAETSSGGITKPRELLIQISTLPEVKLIFTQSFIFPVLQGNNPLTAGNNLRLNLAAEITPISLNGTAKIELTPVAFLVFALGGRLGGGWHINLFGGDLYGTGFNLIGDDGNEYYSGSAFDALLYKSYAGGTFQFDLAAVVPGDWHHVVMQTYHEINIHGNTSAKKGESWFYESDDGENRNGWNYYGNIVLGYQMPIFLNMIAFMAEMDKYLYKDVESQSGLKRELWGDDLIRWTFSNILNFQITEKFSIAVVTQLRTRRNFTNFDENFVKKHNKDNKNNQLPYMHYQKRELKSSDPLRLEFYRVAAMVSYKF